ncbi:hypothetical protein D3C73_681670 [compost metagenome]
MPLGIHERNGKRSVPHAVLGVEVQVIVACQITVDRPALRNKCGISPVRAGARCDLETLRAIAGRTVCC